MVSRRNFFTITVVMLVVLFMFQIPEVIKNRVNHYGKNVYEEQADTGLNEECVYRASVKDIGETGRFVVYIGKEADGALGNVVEEWCLYTKRYLKSYPSIDAYEPEAEMLPEAVLIDSAYLDAKRDINALEKLTESGINLIFCNLPDISEIDGNPRFQKLLGIHQILYEEVETIGIMLLDGFLLGGQKEYVSDDIMEETQQDFQLTMPWYRVSSGTRTYMYGIMSKDVTELENEDLPAVIWRNGIGDAKIFAVNGDYLAGNTGIGLLDAMLYEMRDYDMYPVINAQNFVVLNFPDLTDENTGEMMERYSQTLKAVYREIVWPGLVSVAQQNSLKMTCMVTPRMDYTSNKVPEEDLLIYYMKLFQEQNAEMGLSGTHEDSMDIDEKLDRDTMFMEQVIPEYTMLSFYQGNMTEEEADDALTRDTLKNVRTVFSDYEDTEPLVAYRSDTVLNQRGINSGISHTFRENLRMISIQTALGYSNIQIDVNPVAYPENDEDSWEKMSQKFASNTSTYWKKFRAFEKTTLAESYTHIQKFLALNYTQERTGDTIVLDITDFDKEAWFILRTHGEIITEAVGAEFVRIEEDAYLITATDSHAVFTVEKTELAHYYEGRLIENAK